MGRQFRKVFPGFLAGILLLLVWCRPVMVQAQKPAPDVNFWFNAYFEKKVTKHFLLHLNQQDRFNNNISTFNMAYFDLGMTLKFNKRVKILADYVFINRRHSDYSFGVRHQFYTAIILKHDFGDLEVSYRNMIQSEVEEGSIGGEGVAHKAAFYDRDKLTASYKLAKRHSVYMAAELFFPFRNGAFGLDRLRSFAGYFYDFSKESQLELYVAYQTDLNSYNTIDRDIILGLGYSFKF